MFTKLKDNDLDDSFLNDLISITKINDIKDWFVIHKTMETTLDHNGTYCIDSLYILSHENLKEVVLYFSQMDNSLSCYKIVDTVSFVDFLQSKFRNDIVKKTSKDISNIHLKAKNFQSFILTNKLENNLQEKNSTEKKLKL
jgi:hypothetical protein